MASNARHRPRSADTGGHRRHQPHENAKPLALLGIVAGVVCRPHGAGLSPSWCHPPHAKPPPVKSMGAVAGNMHLEPPAPILHHVQHSQLILTTFFFFQHWYAECQHQKFFLQGVLNRMRNLKLSKAWEQWQFWYEQRMKEKFMLSGAMNRMRNFHLSRAWEQWQFWYEEVKASQHYLSGCVNRMRNFHLSRAWERWQA